MSEREGSTKKQLAREAPHAAHANADYRVRTAPSRPPESKQRQYVRHVVEVEVGLHSESQFYMGFTENMSVGGVFVATHKLRPVGTPVEFTIYLPTTPEPVRGTGEVRWIREPSEKAEHAPGIGVRFVELEPGGEEAIKGFLALRAPMRRSKPE